MVSSTINSNKELDTLSEKESNMGDDITTNSPTTSDCSAKENSAATLWSTPEQNSNVPGYNNSSTSCYRRYSCTKCDRNFARRDELNIHYTHTHRERPRYACDVCELVFMVKRELSTHVRIHNGEQPQRCNECGMEFGTRQLLNKHNMVHSGIRSHYCPICPQAFFQKGHLTQHMQIHAGVRPHKCPLCVKTFIFKFDLNRHMKIHAERGGTSCDCCGKSFTKKAALEEHALKCKKRADGCINIKKQMKRRHEQSVCNNKKVLKLESLKNDITAQSDNNSNLFNNLHFKSSDLNCPPTLLKHQSTGVEAQTSAFMDQSSVVGTYDAKLIVMQNLAYFLSAASTQSLTNAQASLSSENLACCNNIFTKLPIHPYKQRQLAQISPQVANLVAASILFNMTRPNMCNKLINNTCNGYKVDEAYLKSSFYCTICAENFDNSSAYITHFTIAHIQNIEQQQQYFQHTHQKKMEMNSTINVEDNQPMKNGNNKLATECTVPEKAESSLLDEQFLQHILKQVQYTEEIQNVDSATSSSSCASSPQKSSSQQMDDVFQFKLQQHKNGVVRNHDDDDDNLHSENEPVDIISGLNRNEFNQIPICSHSGEVTCTREYVLQKELNAVRTEVDRLRKFMEHIGTSVCLNNENDTPHRV